MLQIMRRIAHRRNQGSEEDLGSVEDHLHEFAFRCVTCVRESSSYRNYYRLLKGPIIKIVFLF